MQAHFMTHFAALCSHMPYMMPQIQPTMPPLYWQNPIARAMQKNCYLLQQVEEENIVPDPATIMLLMRQRMAEHLESVTTEFLHSWQQISQQPLSPIVIVFSF